MCCFTTSLLLFRRYASAMSFAAGKTNQTVVRLVAEIAIAIITQRDFPFEP
jgi:hypothetical protein